MLIEVNESDFKNKIEIRFDNITEGFNKFKSKTLKSNEENEFEKQFIDFLKKAVIINGVENSYVDFYYNLLSQEDKKRLNESIDDADKLFIKEFEKKNSKAGIYFNLTLESIPLIAKLNTKEILFSTIYFGKEKITIWGNYNKQFPVFYTDDKIYNKYKLIAEKNKLVIE
ncbi:MAG: hypothetical protein IIV48_00420 [Clostridium sp.]|nr:hypothetical protein [Clostridium sp.]